MDTAAALWVLVAVTAAQTVAYGIVSYITISDTRRIAALVVEAESDRRIGSDMGALFALRIKPEKLDPYKEAARIIEAIDQDARAAGK